MKMDIRTSIALCLLVATVTAAAQNAQPEQQNVPLPEQTTPSAPTPPSSTQPAQQTAPPAQSPPPPSYPPPQNPPPRQWQYGQPQWAHSETTYYNKGFQYQPFRFHVDAGGTITQRTSATYLNNGWNVGAGLTWYPASHLPLGLRLDGTYNEFGARNALLQQASTTYGTTVNDGTVKMWGGDADLEIDFHFSPYARMYLLGGGGWYRQQITYRQIQYNPGLICYWWGCGPGSYAVSSVVARNDTDWHFARNAGVGVEFALAPRTSFFVEARYMRLDPRNSKSDFLPIRAGLRF